MKVLISWIAFNNDFTEGKVSEHSPNMAFHKYFFDHDKHILLSSAPTEDEDPRYPKLANALALEFPEHNIDGRFLAIQDPIDLKEVKDKIEAVLLEFRDHEIDIFFSPGTSIMQVSWYICHSTLGLKTRLLQTRPARHSKSKKPEPELLEIEAPFLSTTPQSAIIRENNLSKPESAEDYRITKSLELIYEKAYKAAQAEPVTCLITGATGTGKEHLAHYIHAKSGRKEAAFITVNCSALGDSLLESRLFGYKKGAFTGADRDTPGIFKEAAGGTVFLDEIGDISPYMQQSLLRVLQEKEITPVGGKSEKVNVRIIAATHKNLTKLCEEEKFRWDLYYRLAVVELELPNLIERGIEERKEMIDFFLTSKKRQFRRQQKIELGKDALQFLLNYPFPGNIRELENTIETLYVFGDKEIGKEMLPKRLLQPPVAKSYALCDMEKNLIYEVLQLTGNNHKRSCEIIGYGSVNTLKKKMKEYGLM